MRTNGIKSWFLAARPKTLTGAAAPVLIGGALALHEMEGVDYCRPSSVWPLEDVFPSVEALTGVLVQNAFLPFLLCLLFAFVMQIDSNFVNDYFDFKKGTDREDRLGPERACAQGWVTPKAMRVAIALTTAIACLVGLPLILWGGLELVAVGVLCVVFCFLYTTCLSYRGYGDLLVLVFFGVVPVCMTEYVLSGTLDWTDLLASVSCGLAIDCLLMVNNYRDRNQDKISGKRTLVVRFGKSFGLNAYMVLGLSAFVLGSVSLCHVTGKWYSFVLMLVYAYHHLMVARRMRQIDGKALNGILGGTARNIFLYGVLFAASLLLF